MKESFRGRVFSCSSLFVLFVLFVPNIKIGSSFLPVVCNLLKRNNVRFSFLNRPIYRLDGHSDSQKVGRTNQRTNFETSKFKNTYKHSRTPSHGRQTVPILKTDFSFLDNFTSNEEIFNWIQQQNKPLSVINDQVNGHSNNLSYDLNNYNLTNYDETELIIQLCERGALDTAKKFVLNIAKYKTSHLYTAMLRGIAKDVQEEALWKKFTTIDLLDDIIQNNINLNSYIVSAMFGAYCNNANDAIWLKQYLYDRLGTYAFQSEYVWEAAIYACITKDNVTMNFNKHYAWDIAKQFFMEYHKEVQNEWNETSNKSFVEQRHRVGNKRVFRALVRFCQQTRNVDNLFAFVMEYFESLLTDFSITFVGEEILKAYTVIGDHEKVGEVLRWMSSTIQTGNNDKHSSLDIRHCTQYLRVLVEAGLVQKAADFLMYMAHDDCRSDDDTNRYESFTGILKPDTLDMNALKIVLLGCKEAGNGNVAMEVLVGIKEGRFGLNVLQQLDERCYNTVISTLDDSDQAKSLIREMRLTRRNREGVIPPSIKTYTCAMGVCRKLGDLDNAMFLLKSAKSDGIEPDVFMFTTAIWTAAKSMDYEAAFQILDEMKNVGCEPNVITYNGVLAALSSCGKAELALSILKNMREKHISPTFNTFFHIAGAIRKVKGDEEKLSFLWRVYISMDATERQVDVGGCVLESLITTYGSLGHFKEAEKVFDSITGPSDAPCLRALLFACSLASPPEWEEALSLLHTSDIVSEGKGPGRVDPIALCNTMLACSKANEWEESLNLLRLYGGKNASIVAINSLIAACGRGGRPDMAIEVLNEMECYGVQPDGRSYRNAVIACNQAEHEQLRPTRPVSDDESHFAWWECAVSLLRRMKESGIRPDTPTLSSAISACEAAGQWQLALDILQTAMDEEELYGGDESTTGLNVFCWNAAIAACQKGGAWVEALEIYERMKAQGGRHLVPNIVTLGSLILALDQAGQKDLAMGVYEEGIRKRFLKSPWRVTTDSNNQVEAMDLHQFSASLSKAAIRSHIESLLSQDNPKIENWIIIVGKGLRSKSDPILKTTVIELLWNEYGIKANYYPDNTGRLVVAAADIAVLLEKRKWR